MPRVKGYTNRPKKKKVKWLDEPASDEPQASKDNEDAGGEGSSPTGIMQVQVSAPESPGAKKRKEAEEIFDDAMMRWEVAQELAEEARAKERMVKRLVDAKERRLEASYARERKRGAKPLKNPWNRVRRSYENVINDYEASFTRQAADKREAECEARAAICHVNVLQLEIARLKRELRRACK